MVATNYPSSMESPSQGIKSFVSKELDVIVIKRDWRSRCISSQKMDSVFIFVF